MTVQPGTAPDRSVINVAVEEQSTGELSFGAGFSSTESLLADVRLRERDAVPSDERLDPSWLVARGIVDAASFRSILPRLATRSLFWRVRVEGRIERVEDGRAATEVDASAPRTILEAVIDLTGERPRLASLRDVTTLPDAIRMLVVLPRVEERPELDAELDAEPAPAVTPENAPPFDEIAPPSPDPDPLEESGAAEGNVPSARSGANGIGRWKRGG